MTPGPDPSPPGIRPGLSRLVFRGTIVALGAAALVVALLGNPQAAGTSAARTWGPFVLVTGLLMIGVVANADGTFEAAGRLLDRVPGGPGALFAAAMGLVAVVTVVLNLDTSVAFLTPVLLHAARRRGTSEERLLYGCVFMSNAASLLLPASNLTNLLVVSGSHLPTLRFAAAMAAPWSAAVAVTTVVVALACRNGRHAGPEPRAEAPPARLLGLAGVSVAVVLMLLLPDPALPVLVTAAALVAVALWRRRTDWRGVLAGVDVAALAGLFGVATALGALARVWSYPGQVLQRAGAAGTATVAALASVLVNNLPAAVLLGSRSPAHPTSLLLGLNIGPNLAVTGSLSALVWWQAARGLGARPSAWRYSAIGIVLVPLSLGAALLLGRPGF